MTLFRKKAQVPIFEQVLLFLLGVTIFVVCFAVFSIYQNHFIYIGISDQLDEVKTLVISNIVKLANRENETESEITMEIPRHVGNEPYRIELSQNGLNIITLVTNISRSSSVYNLNYSINLNGIVSSMSGKVVIYKKGNEITIS